MGIFEYIYLGLVTAVMVFAIFKISDLTMKIRRLKKRYDLLLRGRGELKLEELLKAHSHDIDLSVKKLKYLEANFTKISGEIKDDRKFLDNKMTEMNSLTNMDLTKRSDKQVNDLDVKLNNINSALDKKIDNSFAKLSNDLNRANNDLISANKNLESNLYNKLSSFDKKYNERSNSIDAKFTNEVNKINEDRKATYKKMDERHSYDIANLKQLDEENYEKLLEIVNREDKAINDNLGLAIQQVSLYKYNALSNQTGDLSFTMVLLDRLNNGVMLTSINGRDASYTYSKEIRNGKSVVDISPEEETALRMVVKK